jgi:hypothetical protein
VLSKETLDEQRDNLRGLFVPFFGIVSPLPHSAGKVSPKSSQAAKTARRCFVIVLRETWQHL